MKKNIDDYTHEELLKLSNEELSKLFKNEREKEYDEGIKFKEEIYSNYSFDEKVKFWSGELHRQMRWQVESGLDAYDIYYPKWYESTKKFEPEFDKIMDEVFSKYWGTGADWSKEEYLKRIGKFTPPLS